MGHVECSELGRLNNRKFSLLFNVPSSCLRRHVHAEHPGAQGHMVGALACFLCASKSAMAHLQSAQEELVARDLFGGAMVMGMPGRFVDVSDFRPIPDNQEVRYI